MAAELGNVDEGYSATHVAVRNGAQDRLKEGYFISTFLSFLLPYLCLPLSLLFWLVKGEKYKLSYLELKCNAYLYKCQEIYTDIKPKSNSINQVLSSSRIYPKEIISDMHEVPWKRLLIIMSWIERTNQQTNTLGAIYISNA